SDDPTGAARAERALAGIGRADADQRSVDASVNSMTLAEGALDNANDLLQDARETLMKAGNATYGDSERKELATHLRDLRQQLLAIANRSDAAGNYLFGGQGSIGAPFLDTAGGVQFRGAAGSTQVPSSESLPSTVDGNNAWMQAGTGNGVFETNAQTTNGSGWIDKGRVTDPAAITGSSYSIAFGVSGGATTYSVLKDGVPTALAGVPFESGKSIEFDGMSMAVTGAPADGDTFTVNPSTPDLTVFDALDKAASALETPNHTSGEIAQINQNGIRDIDSVAGRLQSVRGQVGDTLNRADAATDRLSASRLASQTEQVNATGLDMARGISDFKNTQVNYDTALKSYGLIQQMSLFKYIG
ncbi:MAG: flagellar hook protein, partial [Rhizobacter sp.]|nr:flagellar hook protein [Rhizobacter sp.]